MGSFIEGNSNWEFLFDFWINELTQILVYVFFIWKIIKIIEFLWIFNVPSKNIRRINLQPIWFIDYFDFLN